MLKEPWHGSLIKYPTQASVINKSIMRRGGTLAFEQVPESLFLILLEVNKCVLEAWARLWAVTEMKNIGVGQGKISTCGPTGGRVCPECREPPATGHPASVEQGRRAWGSRYGRGWIQGQGHPQGAGYAFIGQEKEADRCRLYERGAG